MKKSTGFFCRECGYESPKWLGQCPSCKNWNTFVEEPVLPATSGKSSSVRLTASSEAVRLDEIEGDAEFRLSTGEDEMDRVLGGGIVPGSLILIGGDPGIGKSTLLLQVCGHLAKSGKKILYVSGEESPRQIKMRADRMGVSSDSLFLFCETSLERIEETIGKLSPDFVVIDSIQTMSREDLSSAPGSVGQVRECTNLLMQTAKTEGITIFLIGHVTKDGQVAGPKVLEHMVDTVLYFEGDRSAAYRILRSVKNRFGPTNEIGVFEMEEQGLKEVANPSSFLLQERAEQASGSVVSCSIEGTRPILLEVQALISKSHFGTPRRTSVGTDINRVNLLMAVCEKRLGLSLSDKDAYVNVTGGVRVSEPSLDLAIVAAVVSSCLDIPLDDHLVIFGEVGLSGEVRSVSQAGTRLKEAKRLGFTTCILPSSSVSPETIPEGLTCKRIRNVRQLTPLLNEMRGNEKELVSETAS